MAPLLAKAALRRALRARRRVLDPSAVARASSALASALLDHPAWPAATNIAAFVGVHLEPDTRPLLEAALAQGRALWLPRVLDGRSGRSELVLTASLEQLGPAGFGLLEPRPRPHERTLPRVTPDGPIDLVLVPGLAFGSDGARIGFGAGHYDRLLAPVADASHPVRVGLCLASFLDPIEGPIPTAEHDVSMHWIATEDGMHRCGPRGDPHRSH